MIITCILLESMKRYSFQSGRQKARTGGACCFRLYVSWISPTARLSLNQMRKSSMMKLQTKRRKCLMKTRSKVITKKIAQRRLMMTERKSDEKGTRAIAGNDEEN